MYTAFRNGNREIVIETRDNRFYVGSDVFDGVKWQYGHRKAYKTLTGAKKAAAKHVASISAGWTQFPEWTITEG